MELKLKIKSNKLLENSLWLFILQVFNTVMPLVTLPYITRVLGTNNYGVFSLALNWVTYFQVIVEYGFGFTGARKVSVGESKNREYNLQNLYSNIITARIYLLIIAYVIMTFISVITQISIRQYISMNILFLMIIGIAFQLTWLFQGMQDMKVITIINALSRVISVLFIFLLVRNSNQIYVYCFCYSITFVFSALIGVLYARKKYGLKVRLANYTEAWKEIKDGWYLFASQAMSKIFSGFGTTVLGFVATKSIIGIYSAIYKISFVLILFFTPISQALFPHISIQFSKSFANGEKTVKKYSKYVILCFSCIGGVLILFRQSVVSIAFGEAYLEFADLIIPLIIWTVISIINNFLGPQYLVASGNQRLYSNAFSISMIFTVILNIYMGYKWNVYGVAFAAVIGEAILTILLIYNICIKLKRRTNLL